MTNIIKKTRHTLAHPFEMPGEARTIDHVDIRRIKGKDLRQMEEHETATGKTFFLVQTLTGLPAAAVDEIDGEDFDAIAKVIEGFLGRKARRST